jgi:hypothetical protein
MTSRVAVDHSSVEADDQPCYVNDDIIRIASSYRLKCQDAVWPIWFKERLERIAWIFREARAEVKPATPSTTMEHLDRLRQRVRYLITQLEKADFQLQGELELAAKELADMYGLPDFEAETIVYESIPPGNPITKNRWPVERQIRKSRQALDYLLAVFDIAYRRMTDEKEPGGNRPDEHLHELVRAIDGFYRETAADPRDPYSDDEAATKPGRGDGARGELLELMHSVLWPLGVEEKSPVGLLNLWKRATGRV